MLKRVNCYFIQEIIGKHIGFDIVFMLFQEFYERVLLNEHEPEMRRAPLDKIILDTKCLDMGPPKEILALALDPPDLGSIKM